MSQLNDVTKLRPLMNMQELARGSTDWTINKSNEPDKKKTRKLLTFKSFIPYQMQSTSIYLPNGR